MKRTVELEAVLHVLETLIQQTIDDVASAFQVSYATTLTESDVTSALVTQPLLESASVNILSEFLVSTDVTNAIELMQLVRVSGVQMLPRVIVVVIVVQLVRVIVVQLVRVSGVQ